MQNAHQLRKLDVGAYGRGGGSSLEGTLGTVSRRRHRLAQRRRAVGLSQEGLAEKLGIERTTVARWERGETEPQPWWRPKLAEALQLPVEDVDELLADTPESVDGEPERTPAASLVDGFADDHLEELRMRLLNAAAVDGTTIALLATQADHIREIDRSLGARVAKPQLHGYLDAIKELRSFGISPNQREPLARLYADAATLAGWQCLDLGEPDRAWLYYEAAKDAAREADHSGALAHALAEQAYVLVELGELASALHLADHARSIAGTAVPTLLRCWLEAVVGELHAAMGEETDTRRAFDAAERLLQADLHDPELPYVILSDVHLARWRGNARARLGDAAATDDLRHAAYGMDASFTRARAGLHVDLASALVAGGRQGEAKAELRQAKTLAARVGSARQRRRVRRLESALAA